MFFLLSALLWTTVHGQEVPLNPDVLSNVSFTTDEINKERGVIHEEWRTYGGASMRMGRITNKVLFDGSKYATHSVIGELDVIDNFEPDLLRKFYRDWYRPDNQAIIVVGDFDKEEMKKKVEKTFGDIPKPEGKMNDARNRKIHRFNT